MSNKKRIQKKLSNINLNFEIKKFQIAMNILNALIEKQNQKDKLLKLVSGAVEPKGLITEEGKEMIVNIMLQYRGAILNHIIENSAQFETDVYKGNWDMFNNLMQLHKVEKTFYVFVYSKTSDSGFVNLQAMRNIFIAAWKVLDKEGNIKSWTTKDGQPMSEVIKTLNSVRESMDKSEFLQKPNIFISLQLGFVTQGEETAIIPNGDIIEADADKTDDLPF